MEETLKNQYIATKNNNDSGKETTLLLRLNEID